MGISLHRGQRSGHQRQVGSGRAFYLGTYLTQELVSTLFDQVLAEAKIEPLLPTLPEESRSRYGRAMINVFFS
jgi:hypothetical protein